jgi:hypothetical protein
MQNCDSEHEHVSCQPVGRKALQTRSSHQEACPPTGQRDLELHSSCRPSFHTSGPPQQALEGLRINWHVIRKVYIREPFESASIYVSKISKLLELHLARTYAGNGHLYRGLLLC